MEDSGIDSDPKPTNHADDKIYTPAVDSPNYAQTSQRSTTKQLQKKLEERIEQAKHIQRSKNYVKYPKHDKQNTSTNSTTGLISIQRLHIPHKNKEHLPLIEYWHSESESDDETILFPTSKAKDSKHKQDLTDTFSIEDLSEESEDSLNLDPTQPSHSFMKIYTPPGCCSCHCHIL